MSTATIAARRDELENTGMTAGEAIAQAVTEAHPRRRTVTCTCAMDGTTCHHHVYPTEP